MKRKGFTLVELLAVIAILAILVIIALPNVMGLFNTAKENSFKTEVEEVFKTAQQTWMQDSMFKTDNKVYSRVKNGSCTNSLDLSGRSDLEYYIVVDKSGKVKEYYATDGTFQYSYNEGDLKIEKITEVQKVADVGENKLVIACDGVNGQSNVVTPNYVYLTKYTGYINVGDTLPDDIQYFDSYQAAKSNYSNRGFVRLELSDDRTILSANVGYVLNDNEYYFDLGTSNEILEANKAVALRGFVTDFTGYGQSTCSGEVSYTCWNSQIGMHVYLYDNGHILIENQRDHISYETSRGIGYYYRPD